MKKLLAITLWIALAPAESHAASLMPQGKQAYHAASGAPLAGGKVYTYAAGTSTPLATYSDQAGATPNANPVVLDSRGEASIFWGAGPYKVTLRTSADALVWTQDNLYPPFTAAGAATLYNGGSAAAPELTWIDDTNSGFYVIGEDNIGLSLGGTKRWDFAAAGSTLTGTLTVSGATTLQSTLGVTGAATLGGTVAITGATTGAAATFDSLTLGTLTVAHAATFTDPVTVGTATSSQHAATKGYVDALGADLGGATYGTGWSVLTWNWSIGTMRVVYSDATADATSAWTSVLILPAGSRPQIDLIVPGTAYDASATTYYPCLVEIKTDGNVRPFRYDNGTSYATMFAIGTGDKVFVNAAFAAAP
jgi:hypothetical protein